MNKFCRLIIPLLCCVVATTQLSAQQPPFYTEVQQFKKLDSIKPPPSNANLFIGSSSFTMWKDVQTAFPKNTIINRGFGGSSLPHLVYYFDDVVRPYNPKQIVIYCGENDLTVDSITPAIVLRRFKQLFEMIRTEYPKLPVVFVSLKPSPSRQNLMPKMLQSNQLIKSFLKKKKKTKFVDVYSKMLLADGTPNPTLYINDKLHMNAKGYAIWQKAIQPHLK